MVWNVYQRAYKTRLSIYDVCPPGVRFTAATRGHLISVSRFALLLCVSVDLGLHDYSLSGLSFYSCRRVVRMWVNRTVSTCSQYQRGVCRQVQRFGSAGDRADTQCLWAGNDSMRTIIFIIGAIRIANTRKPHANHATCMRRHVRENIVHVREQTCTNTRRHTLYLQMIRVRVRMCWMRMVNSDA